MNLFADIRIAARIHADYRRTLSALADLPAAVRADIGLDGQDLRTVAQKAVYGD